MTSNSPASTDTTAQLGLLRVEVPHWAVQIRVFDGLGQIVRQADDMPLAVTDAAKAHQIWSASTTLPFGVYEIEVLIDGQTVRQLPILQSPDAASYESWYKSGLTVRQLAVVHGPDGCLLTQTSWEELIRQQHETLTKQQQETSAKQPEKIVRSGGTVTIRELQTSAVEEWSRKITGKDKSENSGLFVFVRTLTPEKRTPFFDNLSLFDQNDKLVTTFKEGVELDKKAGWLAFNASLPAGFYSLKRQQYGAHRTCYQPLYLCEGWQTQVFLEAKLRPSLRTLTLNMARLGAGFDASDETTLAAAILLDSLKRSTDPDRLVTVDTVKKLMGGKIDNPWLGILAAYTIRLQQDQMLIDDEKPSDLWPQMLNLLPELLSQLTVIKDHPDVQALNLDKNKPAEAPIPYPPLLYAGLRRVQQHALTHAQTIPVGSVLGKILPRVATTTAWTAWRQSVQPATTRKPTKKQSTESDDSVESDAPVAMNSRGSSVESFSVTSSSPDYLRAVSPKLPIYQVQITSAVAGEVNAPKPVQSSAETFWNATALKAAQDLFSSDPNVIPANTQRVDSTEDIKTILNTALVDEISQASGVPLAQVESSLKNLKNTNQQSAKTAKNLTHYDRTVFGYALQKSIEGYENSSNKGAIESAISDPLPITIEECVNKLIVEANRLTLRAPEDLVKQSVERLIALADQLLVSAKFSVITNTDGEIQFANGVFVILLNQEIQLNQNVLENWGKFFKTAPFGQSVLPAELIKKETAGEWTLQRTVLHDNALDQSIYVNIFQNKSGLILTQELLKDFEKCFPKLALPVSSLAYSKSSETKHPGEESARQAQKLEKCIFEMETLLQTARSPMEEPAETNQEDLRKEINSGPQELTSSDKSNRGDFDLPAEMFRSGENFESTIIVMNRRMIGPINVNVQFTEVDGMAMFEGDIVLTDDVEEARKANESGSKGVGRVGEEFRWPDGIVPYVVKNGLDAVVQEATKHWMDNTPFKFIKRTNETDFISFERRDGCFSSVGRKGGMQVISIGDGCSLGSAIHEIGHALGLWHEQNRSDRDQFIKINFDNIDLRDRNNFNKHVLDGKDLGGYDFGSIMHYPANAFAIDRSKPTIETVGGQPIGQRTGLSKGDIAAIRLMYPKLDWPSKIKVL